MLHDPRQEGVQEGLPISGRQFALYEFQCLEDAWPRLVSVEEHINREEPLPIVFPDNASRALFEQRYGKQLKVQALYFTPASFVDCALKQLKKELKLDVAFIPEPACLALVAEAAQNLNNHPLADLFKQKPEYVLSLLPLLSPAARGYFPAYLYELKAKLEASLGACQVQSLAFQGGGIVEKIHKSIFSHLIFWGFSGKDWEHSLGLLLGLYSGQQVLFFLQHLPGRAQELLISTLEAYSGGECEYIGREGQALMPMPEGGCPGLHWAASALGLEGALLGSIQAHLSRPSPPPLVLVFNSEISPSGLGLALGLDALAMPYFSALKRPLRLPRGHHLLKCWLAYQKELSASSLLDWLNALLCEKDPLLLEKLRKALRPAVSLYATQQAPVLLKALGNSLHLEPSSSWLMPLLEPLEKQASFKTFRERVIALNTIGSLGWESFLPQAGPERLLDCMLQVSSFILYLEHILQAELDALQEPQPTDASPAIYLLTPELALQMGGAEFILADLNEALAPPLRHPLLNASTLLRLNALHVLQGPAGEGQDYLTLPTPYLLSPLAREANAIFAIKELADRPSLSQVYLSESTRPLGEPRILDSGRGQIREEPECTQAYMRIPSLFLTNPEIKRQNLCKWSNEASNGSKGSNGSSISDSLSCLNDSFNHPYVQALGEALAWDKATLAAKVQYIKGQYTDSPVTSFLRGPLRGSLSELAKDQLQTAHKRRQDPSLPFDTYSFCLYPEDARTLILPAKAWEAFFQNPSQVWFQHILRVEKWLSPNEVPASALLVGTWVHDWLTLPSGGKSMDFSAPACMNFGAPACAGLRAPSFFCEHISQKAQQALKHLKAIYQAADIALHPSLLEHWKRAQAIALDVARALEGSEMPCLVSEWPLPDAPLTTVTLPQGSILALRGRIDAIVSSKRIDLNQPAAHSQTPVWILDFKTGKTPPLSLTKLQKDGTGLQIALYALALRSLGFQQVYCSVVRPKEALEPQLYLADLDALEGIYSKMEALLQKGIFGIKPLSYRRKDQSPYPIACLPISDSILEAKAASTLPDKKD